MFGKLAARAVLRVTGWQLVGDPPAVRKMIVLAAPHTSNWDLLYMLCIAAVNDIKPSWLAKHTLFKGLQGRVLRRLGGVPVDRRSRHDTVSQLAAVFASQKQLVLVIPPAGTRGYRDHWKSGFYHIARSADVPVVLGFLDYQTRRCGLGPTLTLTGDVRADMDRVRAFYSGMQGRYPAKTNDIRLRGEDLPATPSLQSV